MDVNKILLRSFIAFLLTLFVCAMLIVSYLARQKQILTNYASDPEIDAYLGDYVKDEIIIKFKETPENVITVDELLQEVEKPEGNIDQVLEMVGLTNTDNQVPDSLVRLHEKFPVAEIEQAFPLTQTQSDVQGISSDASSSSKSELDGIYTITFENDVPIPPLAQELSQRSDIEFAEPNFIVKTQAIPTDTNFGLQWGLHNTGASGGRVDADIDAPEAWDIPSPGTQRVIVAVLDTGVDTGHLDLTNRIWRNTNEQVFNDIDDDNNGYIDDVHGWNFLNDNYNISDSQGHGTHIAGIIGAERNNALGVTGVADNVKIMPVKFLDQNGEGTLSAGAQGIRYAADNGAKVINCSFGAYTSSPPQVLLQAIEYAKTKGVIVVAAVGNEGQEIGKPATRIYPANYDLDNIITVASTTRNDTLSGFSNYSATDADLAAPGSDIYSTLTNNRYGLKSGTSMATPFVAGAVAMAMTKFPDMTYTSIRTMVLSTVDVKPSLNNKVVTGGRLNLERLISSQSTQPTATPTQPILQSPTPTRTPTIMFTPTPTFLLTSTPTPTTIQPTLPQGCPKRNIGDANCDSRIDLFDYVCWMQEFINGQPPLSCTNADFDSRDGVKILDYAIWLNTFLYQAPAG